MKEEAPLNEEQKKREAIRLRAYNQHSYCFSDPAKLNEPA